MINVHYSYRFESIVTGMHERSNVYVAEMKTLLSPKCQKKWGWSSDNEYYIVSDPSNYFLDERIKQYPNK